MPTPPKRYSCMRLLAVVSIAIAGRLLLALVSHDLVDVENYERVANAILSHGVLALYRETSDIYPYPPVWFLFETLAKAVASTGFISFSLGVRLPMILADAGIVVVLWLWGRQQAEGRAAILALAYAVNPVSIIVTSMHGQFDAIAVLFSLLAVYLLAGRQRLAASAIALALGVAVKSYPALLLLPILLSLPSWRERVLYATVAIVPVCVLLLPFVLVSPSAVLGELFGYRGFGIMGYMVPIRSAYIMATGEKLPANVVSTMITLSSLVFLMFYFVSTVRARGLTTLTARVILVFISFYVIHAGISPQYLVWVLPFLLLLDGRETSIGAILYTLTGTCALLGYYAYAFPEIYPVSVALPTRLSQIIYGMTGTAWWLACAGILIMLLRPGAATGSSR